jgi:dTDP-4-amino-4,6-dideoxygalactose transaminase
MMALDLGPGDEVITTPFTFFATAGSIVRTGATPVFAEIDPETYNINPALIEGLVTSRTKAILPVHLFGQMCDMDPIMEIARKHGLHVIEDAAQSIAATYNGRKAGSIGTAGCFSFFPSKNLGAAGDGGMIVTNNEDLYNRLVTMRNHGAKPKYYHKFVGGNFRLDPLQAAILMVKFPHLAEWTAARQRNAAYYNSRFKATSIQTPMIRPGCVSIYNQYVVRVGDRDALKGFLKDKGIGTEIYYPRALHEQECFAGLGYAPSDFPESSAAAAQVLALPIYPELSREMMDHVANVVLEATQSRLVHD